VTQNASCYLLTTNIWFGKQETSQIAIMLFADFSTGYLFYGVDISSVAGVLDEPFQLTPLSGVAVHARQAT
jgi:hypothetical protein